MVPGAMLELEVDVEGWRRTVISFIIMYSVCAGEEAVVALEFLLPY